jgi:hypothetical protein
MHYINAIVINHINNIIYKNLIKNEKVSKLF